MVKGKKPFVHQHVGSDHIHLKVGKVWNETHPVVPMVTGMGGAAMQAVLSVWFIFAIM